MPELADAEALILTLPETLKPETGAVIETVGGVALLTVTLIATEVV